MCVLLLHVSAHECLKFTGQKMGVGAYTKNPLVRITHIIHVHTNQRINNGWWVLYVMYVSLQYIRLLLTTPFKTISVSESPEG